MGNSNYWTRLFGLKISQQDFESLWEQKGCPFDDPYEYSESLELPEGIAVTPFGDSVCGEMDYYLYLVKSCRNTMSGSLVSPDIKVPKGTADFLLGVAAQQGFPVQGKPCWLDISCYG